MSSQEANEARFAALTASEIEELVDRLTAYARKLVASKSWNRGGGIELLPKGFSAKDLVQAAFSNLLGGGDWDEDKPALLVLKGFIKGTVGNLINSSEHKTNDSLEDEFADPEQLWKSATENITDSDPGHSEIVQRDEDDDIFMEAMEGLADGSPDRLIVEAIFNGAAKRDEVLADTGLTASEYEAAKKRLRRYLSDFRQQLTSVHH